jgi:hypothetical protein
MPVSLRVQVKCDYCGEETVVLVSITNVSGHQKHLEFSAPDLWEVKDIGSHKTRVLCPKCK